MMHQGEDGSMGCCPVLRVDTEVRFTAGVNLPKNLGDSPAFLSTPWDIAQCEESVERF